MLRFYADFFTRAYVYLDRLRHRLPNIDDWETQVEIDVIVIKKECLKIGFQQLADQADRIIAKCKVLFMPETRAVRKQEMFTLLEEYRLAIDQKLKSCLFLRVHTDRKEFYSEDDLPLFGEEVATVIPKSTYHIAEAGRCFALERWDACVHHLMLAIEEALRWWARNLKFAVKRPLILSDWEKILQEARKHLDYLKNQKRTVAMDRKLQRLSEALAHFGFIKDAWRNHSSHGREKYNEQRAKNLLIHVEAFMQSLVTKKVPS